MTIFYSNSKRGFFDSEIHGMAMPDDVVAITPETHAALLEGQSKGQVISALADGVPFLADRPAPSDADVTAAANAVIVEQIEAIERDQQPRAMRDMLLYSDNTRLKALDSQIAALRTQLK